MIKRRHFERRNSFDISVEVLDLIENAQDIAEELIDACEAGDDREVEKKYKEWCSAFNDSVNSLIDEDGGDRKGWLLVYSLVRSYI